MSSENSSAWSVYWDALDKYPENHPEVTKAAYQIVFQFQDKYWIESDLPGHNFKVFVEVSERDKELWKTHGWKNVDKAFTEVPDEERVEGDSGLIPGLRPVGSVSAYFVSEKTNKKSFFDVFSVAEAKALYKKQTESS